jgi:pimeloyl-ACP methyl ester carboxylesterase
MAEKVTHTLEVPGGTLVYDVIASPASGQRPLFLIGHPMGSSGFLELASYFPDRTVVSYDPRGCDRSQVVDADHSPWQNAEDVHQLIGLVGAPADVFGSSGGAVTGLALVSQYPDDVGILVAHEPPILGVLPDGDLVRAAFGEVTEAYHQGGFGAGMASFIALTSIEGEFSAERLGQPAPNPAMFGLLTEDDGGRDNVLLSGVSDPVIEYRLDPEAVHSSQASVVIAAGEESRNQVAGRAAAEVAKLLGTELVMFPSHHGGFNGGEGPYAGKPAEFAAKLREVLAAG